MKRILLLTSWTCLILIASLELRAAESAEAALLKPVMFDFQDMPLKDVADFLQEYLQVGVVLDDVALKNAGLSSDLPVTIKVHNVTLRSALNLMTEQHGLDYKVENGALVLRPAEVKKDAGKRKDAGKKSAAKRPNVAEGQPKTLARLRDALKQKTIADFDKVPLQDALKHLAENHGIQIFLDRRGLKDRKIDPATPVTAKEAGPRSLYDHLKSILDPLKLQAVIRNEVVFVTPKAEPSSK